MTGPEPAGGPTEPELVDAELVDEPQPAETALEEGDLLSAELVAAQAEIDEYRDTLQRLKAEFDNYKKRILREQTALVERASAELLRDLMPVLDALEGARNTPSDAPAEKLREGLEAVWNLLVSVLGNAGLERVAEAEVPFDPEVHEAVSHSPGDAETGPVVESVLRSGWTLKGRTLRPAMVAVRG